MQQNETVRQHWLRQAERSSSLHLQSVYRRKAADLELENAILSKQ